MNLSVTLEYRFQQTPDGAVWTQSSFTHTFWQRYLEAFSQVRVLARVQAVDTVTTDFRRTDGPGVGIFPLPYYLGPMQYLLTLSMLKQRLKEALNAPDALIMRVPSPIATQIVQMLPRGYPYGVEVVGDPLDVFAPGAVRHPLRPFLRRWFARALRQQCKQAAAAAYVTQQALQQRYPSRQDAFATHYSSIEMGEEAFAAAPRFFAETPSPVRLIMVGSLEQMYKAPDVLIDAVAQCVRQGVNLTLTIVGDGKHRPELEARAAAGGLGDRIRFTGMLSSGQAVRNELDKADLFVLPSRTEGLPRALIEAMARGLPCIGSSVGGIPELLPAEDRVAPGDAEALSRKIVEVISHPARMSMMAARNWEQARLYEENLLRQRRLAFYQYVKHETEAWHKGKR